MNDQGKETATKALEDLQPGGSTNIWDGLYLGMEVIRTETTSDRISTLFLLTDG